MKDGEQDISGVVATAAVAHSLALATVVILAGILTLLIFGGR